MQNETEYYLVATVLVIAIAIFIFTFIYTIIKAVINGAREGTRMAKEIMSGKSPEQIVEEDRQRMKIEREMEVAKLKHHVDTVKSIFKRNKGD